MARPEMIEAWKKFRTKREAEYAQAWKEVRHGAPNSQTNRWLPDYSPSGLVGQFQHHWKSLTTQREGLVITLSEEYAVSRHFQGKHPTLRWAEGNYRYVANIVPDGSGDFDEGHFQNKAPEGVSYRRPWARTFTCPTHGAITAYGSCKKCPRGGCDAQLTPRTSLRSLKLKASRSYWEMGGYKRDKARRNEYDYGIVSDISYEDLREYYWLSGYTRFEADLRARQAFESRKERLERWAQGDLGFVGVITYVFPIDEPRDGNPLADHSLWGIESDYDLSYVESIARENGAEALYNLRPQEDPRQLRLPLMG